MNLTRINSFSRILLLITVFIVPAVCHGEEFKVFTSEEYGFSMKYPATWVKTEPRGNYYVVFQAPDLVDNFRNRVHVAAHKPVKDPLEVFLKELRNGIADLQKQSSDKQQVRILDEGDMRFFGLGNTQLRLRHDFDAERFQHMLELAQFAGVIGGDNEFFHKNIKTRQCQFIGGNATFFPQI